MGKSLAPDHMVGKQTVGLGLELELLEAYIKLHLSFCMYTLTWMKVLGVWKAESLIPRESQFFLLSHASSPA